jgi:hypothetical protein
MATCEVKVGLNWFSHVNIFMQQPRSVPIPSLFLLFPYPIVKGQSASHYAYATNEI